MARYRHALCIGATGMLADTTRYLAGVSTRQTLVARHATRFTHTAGLNHATPVDADWHETDAFIDTIVQALAAQGPADLCLLWLHGGATAVRDPLFACLGRDACRVIHVLGSSRGNPRAEADSHRRLLAPYPCVRYHTVILGSVLEGGHRRWLTHAEIAAGAIACEQQGRDIVVGELGAGPM